MTAQRLLIDCQQHGGTKPHERHTRPKANGGMKPLPLVPLSAETLVCACTWARGLDRFMSPEAL